jgi:aspartate carbamoyltransferase catalytic subunit
VKGESQEDSFRTFSSYFDVIVMRTQIGGLAERMAWTLSNSERPVPVINAGSGKDQHPTQALLDIYTLQRSFERRGGIDGKSIVFVGDLARGRTVRSLASLLTNYTGVRQFFVAPPQFQIGSDILAMLDRAGGRYELSADFHSVIPQADAIYMTRVQDEWDAEKGASSRVSICKYSIGAAELRLLKPDAVIMHPLPRRSEISTEVDHDPRAVYWRQMRNGMWIRVALFATIFGCDREIRDYYAQNL